MGEPTRGRGSKGFTLIELMIVASIIAVLAVIAIPQFADLIRKSKEGATKGSLGTLRSAVNVYIAGNEGMGPSDVASLTVNGTYLSDLPIARLPPYHNDFKAPTLVVSGFPAQPCVGALAPDPFHISTAENGLPTNWSHFYARGCGNDGFFNDVLIYIGCSHTDSKGTVWSTY